MGAIGDAYGLTVEFLHEQMPRVEVLAVEIRQYRAAASKSGALVPRVMGQTSRAQAAKAERLLAEAALCATPASARITRAEIKVIVVQAQAHLNADFHGAMVCVRGGTAPKNQWLLTGVFAVGSWL
jgi:hypothetical protein